MRSVTQNYDTACVGVSDWSPCDRPERRSPQLWTLGLDDRFSDPPKPQYDAIMAERTFNESYSAFNIHVGIGKDGESWSAGRLARG